MYKAILILDKFFLKYEGMGGGCQIDPQPEKNYPQKALLGLKAYFNVLSIDTISLE